MTLSFRRTAAQRHLMEDKEEDPPALFIIDSLGSLIMVRGG
jgi:hypothetical protein